MDSWTLPGPWTVSELLWVNAQPFVICADFTRQEETVVVADWLWWWVDGGGECFGMLVQAKRLHRRGGQPQHTNDCERCRRASVSLITALQAEINSWGSLRDAATLAFNMSMPLEDFVDPAVNAGPVQDFNLGEVKSGLREFLLCQQTGARRVARELFRIVSTDRAGHYSIDAAERVVTAADPVITDLPLDKGHFSEPYFWHILRGLRTRVPDYVHDVMASQPPPPAVTDKVGGIVVVRC